MTKTMRTLYSLAAVVILGTVGYAQETPKTVEKKALPNAQQDNGNLVRSLNTLQGNLTLQAGANISITPSGNSLTIAAPNALSGIVHDSSLKGNGTAVSPLSIAPEGPVNPYYGRGTLTILEGNLDNFGSEVPHPSGNQVVVEFASGQCTVPTTQKLVGLQLIVFTEGIGNPYFFTPTFLGTSFGVDTYVFSQPMKLYINPAEEVRFRGVRTNQASTVGCSMQLSGHLIPVPTP